MQCGRCWRRYVKLVQAVGAVLFVIDNLAAASETPDAPAMLRAADAAIEAIYSYDLQIRVDSKWHLRTVPDPAHGSVRWAAPRPGEQLSSQVAFYRQVRAPGGKFHIEILPEARQAPPSRDVHHLISDGVMLMSHNPAEKKVSIRHPRDNALSIGHNYRDGYAYLFPGWSLRKILEQRLEHCDVHGDAASGQIRIDVPRVKNSLLSNFSFRLWLDPEKGYLPTKIERFWREGDDPHSVTTVVDGREIVPGVWAPVKMVTEFVDSVEPKGPTYGQPSLTTTLTVDEARSTWNSTQLDERLFRLTVPKGTSVTDLVSGISFVTGTEGDVAGDMEKLIANAKDVVPLSGPRFASRLRSASTSRLGDDSTGSWRMVLIVANLCLIALLGLLTMWGWRGKHR